MERKIILSRKGFDSANGGKPSPILEDGTLLSLPIPNKGDNNSYSELRYGKFSYYEIMSHLNVVNEIKNCKCHLDPDIYKQVKPRGDDWVACFGQSDAAFSHLEGKDVKKGDIFLFFGWYKQTVESEKTIRYKRGASDQHIIFGYLQVGEKITDERIKEFSWHPHSINHEIGRNVIYKAADKLLNTSHPGYGTFKLSKELVLTKDGYSRSRWELPDCMKSSPMTYHDDRSRKKDYFQSAMIGQEFVMDSTPEIEEWILSIVEKNRVE
ncbi:MAG: hypothetical protein A2Y19_00470 [Firmicutes bacterium GWE2_51_13]|nr:MAG: hypothetical protein A2Y19_00470 [Firmicutes bacterium GWE2_51_13]